MQNLFTIDLVQLRTLRELRERGTITATAAALHLTRQRSRSRSPRCPGPWGRRC